jgi:beta-galactosidase
MTSTPNNDEDNAEEEEEHPRRHHGRLLRRTASDYFGDLTHLFFPSLPRLFPKLGLLDRLVSQNQRSKFTSQHHNGTVWPIHDLLANELLLWLLPTHMMTHLIKFGVILIGLLLGFLWSLLHQHTTNILEDDKSPEYGWACWAFGISLILWIYYSYHTTLYAIGKPWMDPRITSVNRMEMHVPLRLFTSTQSARRAACLPEMVCRASVDDPGPHTPNIYNLDSATEWKFQLLPTVEQALDLVYQQQQQDLKDANANANAKQWTSIPVPSNWMLSPNVPDIPIYTNQKYPFPCTPPIVPRNNPTGIYQRQITLPADWDAASSNSIILQGFESMAWVFINGLWLGCAKDSRLPSEFPIPSEFCRDYDENSNSCTITIVVCRWSDGSYVEDQDHWWMAGLHRSVELVQRSVGADIMDYRVDATASGEINVKVQLRNSVSDDSGGGSSRNIVSSEQDSSSRTRTITARLYADEQLTAEGDWNMASQELWSKSTSITNTTSTPNKENTSLVELQTVLPNVKLWTAETPNLYTLVLEQSQSNGDDQVVVITQVESCRVGFRTIDIEKGVLHVNGKRIMVCGINRHEHDPDHGKVVSLERMKQDITVLK